MAVKMRENNKGLTVKLNLWSLEKYSDKFDSLKARLWVRGEMTDATGKKRKIFNDAGELITTLGKWNSEQFRMLEKAKKKASSLNETR